MMFKRNNQMQESFKGFQMKQSPYHIDRASKKVKPSFRIEEKAVNDLEKHFKKQGLNFSEGMRNLCFKELDNLCLDRKTYNNLECFMLIPKTDDVFMLNNKSQVIAIVNTEADFKETYNHKRPFNDDYNLTYDLIDFEGKYIIDDLKILQNTKDSCVYNTSMNDLRVFDLFRDRQRELYDDVGENFDLNVDDCYFVRFPLNNYLDELIEGQYQHKEYKENHIGVYVLHDVVRERKLFLLTNFYYLSEYEIQMQIDIELADERKFVQNILQSKDDKLIEAMKEALSDKHRKNKLLELKQRMERNLLVINDMIDRCED